MINTPNIAIFATGLEGLGKGGSGARILLEKVKLENIKANVKAIVTQYPNGGVANLSDEYGKKGIVSNLLIKYKLPKTEKDGNFTQENKKLIEEFYQKIIKENDLDFIFLSGWMKKVIGLPAEKVINIHPGPIASQGYGGKNMYGMNIHRKVWEDYKECIVTQSCVTMHYASEKYDEGQIIAQVPVDLSSCENANDVAKAVNIVEHEIQWKITELIISGTIKWSGKKGDKLEIINQEKINNYNLPEGIMFGGTVNLMK